MVPCGASWARYSEISWKKHCLYNSQDGVRGCNQNVWNRSEKSSNYKRNTSADTACQANLASSIWRISALPSFSDTRDQNNETLFCRPRHGWLGWTNAWTSQASCMRWKIIWSLRNGRHYNHTMRVFRLLEEKFPLAARRNGTFKLKYEIHDCFALGH